MRVGLAIATLLLLPGRAIGQPEITLEKMWWGVAGQVTERDFNAVDLELRNDGDQPFDGTITIAPDRGARLDSGRLEIVSDLYLGPGETRIVSLAAFLSPANLEWSLWTSNRPNATIPLDRITFTRSGTGGIVRLAFDGPGGDGAGSLPRLDARRFPTKATVLSALRAVVISSPVRLQAAQESALFDWVAGGGTLIIAETGLGKPPVLGGRLGEATSPIELSPLGRGIVWNLRQPGSAIDRTMIDEFVRSRRGGELSPGEQQQMEADAAALDGYRSQWRQQMPGFRPTSIGDRTTLKYAFDADSSITSQLTAAIQPRSFAVFFVPLAMLYVAALAMLSYHARVKRWRWPRYFAFLAGLILIATVALLAASPFSTTASELTATVVTASPMDEGRTLLRQWESRHAGFAESRTLAPTTAAQLMHAGGPSVRARIGEGPAQTLQISESPLTNSLARAKGIAEIGPPRLTVEASRSSDAIVATVRAAAGSLPTADYPAALLLFDSSYTLLLNRGGTLRTLSVAELEQARSTRFTWGPTTKRNFDFVWNAAPISFMTKSFSQTNPFAPSEPAPLTIEERLLDTLPMVPMIDRSVTGAFTINEMSRPRGQARLLLAGPLTASLDLLGDGPTRDRRGIVIWMIDLPRLDITNRGPTADEIESRF